VTVLALKQFKHDKASDRGLPDYLNYGSIVAPGVVLNKDGSVLAGRYFRGRNLNHLHEIEWDAASAAANRAFCKLGGGWAVWIDDNRLPVSRFTDPAHNHFPCEIAEIIETERREALTEEGATLQSEYVLCLHYTPPVKTKSAVLNLIYDQDKDNRPSAASAILAGFLKALAEFDDQLSAAVDVSPMVDRRWTDEQGRDQLRSDLVNYLYFCVSGEVLDIPLPPHGCYLDGIIGEKPVFPGDMPKVGDNFIACVAISGYPFPEASAPGLLATLDLLPFPLRWSSRYIVLEQPEAEKVQKTIENKWKQQARGWKGIFFADAAENPDAAKMAGEAADAIERTQSAMEGTGYYTCNVILMGEDPDELAENVRIVRRAIRDAGFPTRFETTNAMEAWLGSLPGHCVPNVRRSPIHTTNLADLLPLSSPWQGLDHNPCPFYPPNSPPLIQAVGVGLTPININFHVGDVPHCLGFGPIGSGKSTFLATTALSALRYKGALVWGFDKGRALMPAFRATGKYFDVANDNLAFAPLSVLDTDSDVAWAEEWIADCFHLQTGHAPQPIHTDAIHQAMLILRSGTGRSLTHFVRMVQNQEVREAMAFYSLGGAMGHMLDAETDGLADGLVCGFEIAELMAMGERSLLPVLLYLFRRFAKSLKGQPSYLLLDEAWTMLGHPVFRDKLREWLKELRKANCSVVMATQSLSDAVRSGLMDVLLESCPFRFFGANPAAMTDGSEDEPGPRQMYEKFGLTEAQIELVRQAIPKRQYLISSPDGSALVDLRLGKKALKFVGAGSKEQLARIDRLYREHGDGWAKLWLEGKA
jgi:type IV secretion system protein TrbE